MAAMLVLLLLQFLAVLLIVRVVMSWIQFDPYHPISQFVFNLTEPFLKPVRDILPPMGGLDLSPMVLLFAIQIIGQIFVKALSR